MPAFDLVFAFSAVNFFFITFVPSKLSPEMKVVDTRGEKCPKPIIDTKKALKETIEGETFIVLTDNKTSFNNISRFLADNGIKFFVSESDGTWKFEVNNKTGAMVITPSEDYGENFDYKMLQGNFSVAVSSELMGSGDDILGRQLMKSFFMALSCLERMPSVIAFYNSGVKLAARDSDVAEYLIEIEKKGVELILCGTCVDYFKLEGRLCAGNIGDMYNILDKLSSSGNVIRP